MDKLQHDLICKLISFIIISIFAHLIICDFCVSISTSINISLPLATILIAMYDFMKLIYDDYTTK